MEKREDMMIFALNKFKDQLGLESEASLEGKIEIREIPEGWVRIIIYSTLPDRNTRCIKFNSSRLQFKSLNTLDIE